MLAARNRMRRSSDFRRVMRQGRRAGSPTVVVHRWTAPTAQRGKEAERDDSSRVGLVVSRAVGPSVVRHQVSRRLRHLMRERITALEPGEYVVVRATPRAATASSTQLARDLDRCLR